jgi:NADH-quinone oxidoreductase subunit L
MQKMGGLGKQMPFIRTVFVIGALALAGLPILNGFWSKELILEDGLKEGPTWAYIGMLAGAGLTALYTLRMVWLVFYGQARGTQHAHDAGQAMKLATGVLAVGALTTWLLIGLFGELLENTLPFHHLEMKRAALSKIDHCPGDALALGVVVGLLGWWLVTLWPGWLSDAHRRAAQRLRWSG